jgi:hypothetical protein
MPLNGVRRARDIAMMNLVIEDIDAEEESRSRGGTDDDTTDGRSKTPLGDLSRSERLPYCIPGLLVYPGRKVETLFPRSPILSFFCGCWLQVIRWIDISFWTAFLYVIGPLSFPSINTSSNK